MARFRGHDAVARFAERIPGRIGKVKRLAAFHIWNGVTIQTPRDTGRAAASWNMAVENADLSVAPEAESVPMPMPPTIGKVAPGRRIVISNNLPYIVPLNDGHSTQAPAGFVQSVVREVLANLKAQVDRIRREDEARAGG